MLINVMNYHNPGILVYSLILLHFLFPVYACIPAHHTHTPPFL